MLYLYHAAENTTNQNAGKLSRCIFVGIPPNLPALHLTDLCRAMFFYDIGQNSYAELSPEYNVEYPTCHLFLCTYKLALPGSTVCKIFKINLYFVFVLPFPHLDA